MVFLNFSYENKVIENNLNNARSSNFMRTTTWNIASNLNEDCCALCFGISFTDNT